MSYLCFSETVGETIRDAQEYETDEPAKAAASHAAFLFRTKNDGGGSEQRIVVAHKTSGTHLLFDVKTVHSVEFKARVR